MNVTHLEVCLEQNANIVILFYETVIVKLTLDYKYGVLAFMF